MAGEIFNLIIETMKVLKHPNDGIEILVNVV